jgi:uncharacterized membrane protein
MRHSIRDVLRVIVYTVITFIATVLLVVETPATGGYFNLGEAAIYTIAYLSPPTIAAIASGLGPALADLVLGYWYFAPATFIIKFCEGYTVSKLIKVLAGRGERRTITMLKLASLAIGIVLASVIVALLSFGGGEASIEVGWTPTSLLGARIPIPQVMVSLPSYAWIAIAVLFIVAVVMYVVTATTKPFIVAMTIGGLIMVTGYFFYEYFVSNPLILGREPIGAVFEVPVNIGQFVAGIILAYPVVQFIERARGARGTES